MLTAWQNKTASPYNASSTSARCLSRATRDIQWVYSFIDVFILKVYSHWISHVACDTNIALVCRSHKTSRNYIILPLPRGKSWIEFNFYRAVEIMYLLLPKKKKTNWLVIAPTCTPRQALPRCWQESLAFHGTFTLRSHGMRNWPLFLKSIATTKN